MMPSFIDACSQITFSAALHHVSTFLALWVECYILFHVFGALQSSIKKGMLFDFQVSFWKTAKEKIAKALGATFFTSLEEIKHALADAHQTKVCTECGLLGLYEDELSLDEKVDETQFTQLREADDFVFITDSSISISGDYIDSLDIENIKSDEQDEFDKEEIQSNTEINKSGCFDWFD